MAKTGIEVPRPMIEEESRETKIEVLDLPVQTQEAILVNGKPMTDRQVLAEIYKTLNEIRDNLLGKRR